jgi:pyrroline-5-carboxylate reductase
MTETFGILGMGHMGQAVEKGLGKAGFSRILTSNIPADNMGVVTNSNIVFLTVRPAVASEVLDQIHSELKDKILISLVAGLSISIKDVSTFRLMSSLLISENMGLNIAWTGSNTDENAKKIVEELLVKLAFTRWVASEEEVDQATLTVGAGPGWIAEIIACLPQEMLHQVLAFLDKTGISASELAQMIATPGGITEVMIQTQDFKKKLGLSFEQGGSRMSLVKKSYLNI